VSSHDTTLPRRQQPVALPRELALALLFSPDERQAGRVRRLTPAGLELGRAAADDAGTWALADPRASRAHAAVRWDGERERFLLVDCNSRNGTRLNGRDIERELLAAGDLVRVGDTLLCATELEADLEPEWRAPPDSLLAGASPALQRLTREIARVAGAELAVLVEGETGSGKDVVAREIHRRSGRQGEYVAVNCAALVESLVESELFGHARGAFSGASEARQGLFARAHRGTLLLDEIGELSAAAQAKLLRVLEDGVVRPVGSSEDVTVKARVVCATNRDLAAEVAAGRFRADLYARIKQLYLRVPPLRDRPEDLLPILSQLLRDEARGHRLGADAFEALALHPWPYNVRELLAVVRKALVRLPDGGLIELAHVADDLTPLPDQPAPRAAAPPPAPSGEPTRAELAAVLAHFGGSVSDAARHLGRARTQLYRWLKKHALDPADFR
jgi:DNA-binding NtrC family response regulator